MKKIRLLFLMFLVILPGLASSAEIKGSGYKIHIPDACTGSMINSVEDFDIYSIICHKKIEFGAYVGNMPKFPKNEASKGQQENLLSIGQNKIYRVDSSPGHSSYEEVLQKIDASTKWLANKSSSMDAQSICA